MSGLRIVADRNMRGVEAIFSRYGEIEAVEGRGLDREVLMDADVLLVRSVTEVDRDLLHGTSVRFVGTATSGVEHLDQVYLAQQGIAFAHAQGSNANAVLEYVLAAIAASGDYLERLLQGATLGIVGHGHVGSALAACARALDIGVRVFDPWLADFEDAATLDEVLACDVISLHAELTRQSPWPSFHLLGQERLARISPDALLINASRGAVIDNRALLQRLRNNSGPHCVLDVWEGEPAISMELLRQVQLGTAHIAGYSLDAKLSATRMLAETLATTFDLESPAQGAGGPAADVLQLQQNGAAPALLRALLQGRYDIYRDDGELRQVSLGIGAKNPAPGFDTLRREYPVRRELRNSPVHVPHAPRHFQCALGYRPIAAETPEAN